MEKDINIGDIVLARRSIKNDDYVMGIVIFRSGRVYKIRWMDEAWNENSSWASAYDTLTYKETYEKIINK